MEDKEIWDGIRKGRKDALKELYDHFFNVLYAYGLKISYSSADTEDAIHELFIDIWKYRERLSETTSVRFYLYRALRRKLYKNRILTDKVLNADDDQQDDFQPPVEVSIIGREEENETGSQLKDHIDKLPMRQKEALLLRFYGALSYKEIAEILQINEQSARNLTTRGLEFLRKTMSAWFLLLFF